jgi:hypothetical protein
MKKVFFVITVFVLSLAIISSNGCKKKKEETNECRVCKAAAGIDDAPAQETVCSDQAEQDFRNKHSRQTVTCQ